MLEVVERHSGASKTKGAGQPVAKLRASAPGRPSPARSGAGTGGAIVQRSMNPDPASARSAGPRSICKKRSYPDGRYGDGRYTEMVAAEMVVTTEQVARSLRKNRRRHRSWRCAARRAFA